MVILGDGIDLSQPSLDVLGGLLRARAVVDVTLLDHVDESVVVLLVPFRCDFLVHEGGEVNHSQYLSTVHLDADIVKPVDYGITDKI